MESTRQITRAMEMVAASKLRHAQDRIRDSRPYFEILYGTIAHIACTRPDFSSPYLTRREGKRVCCIVIAGDRGLAGGYNNNMFKLVQQELGEKELSVLPMGKRAVEHFRGRGVPLVTQAYSDRAKYRVALRGELEITGTLPQAMASRHAMASISISAGCTYRSARLMIRIKS